MAKKKTGRRALKSRKLVLPHEMIDTKTESLLGTPVFSRRPNAHWIWIAIIAVGVAGLLWVNKGMVLAAVVNGRPIFRWELNNTLVSRFGKQTLEGMISEQLVAGAAAKAGVHVSQGDIDAKVGDIVKNLGNNVSIDDLLKYQGMTKQDFEHQIRLQLTVEKLLGRDLTITDGDIDNYIATNRATLVATDEASLRQEAKAAITSQKVNEKLQPWFTELKDKAKILRFL